MESEPINEAAEATSTTNANALGFDDAGKLVKFPIAQMLRSETGIAIPSTVPSGIRFVGETWKVDTGSYGATFTNFGGIVVPVKVGSKYVANARFVWNNAVWELQKELVDAPDVSDKTNNSDFNPVKSSVDILNSLLNPESANAFEWEDVSGNMVALISQVGVTKLLSLIVQNSATFNSVAVDSFISRIGEFSDSVTAKQIKTLNSTITEDFDSEYIISQEDLSGKIAWGISNEVGSTKKRMLKGVVLDGFIDPGLINSIAGHDIYTTCNNISAWTQSIRGQSLSLYLERFVKMSTKGADLNFSSSNSLTRTLASRRYYHPEPQGGSPAMQPNYLENVHIEAIADTIRLSGSGPSPTPISIALNHISTLASLTASKKLRILQIGDSVTERSEAANNAPYAGSPISSWEYIKFFFEQDKIDNGNTGHDCIMIGKRTVAANFNVTIGAVTNTVRACAEGFSGWNTRDYLSAKTFVQGNNFYDPAKSGTDKFSLAKYIARFRTMTDAGVRLSNVDAAKGSDVTDTAVYDVCTPNVVVIQLGFNDSTSTYIADLTALIANIKAEYPAMVIVLSFIGAAGSYFPERWPGWQGAAKDISFFEPESIVNGWGYSKRLHDKMFDLFNGAKALENKASGIFFLANTLIQPTANSVSHRLQSEPFGTEMYQPYATTAFAYHPNNLAHACWGYHGYSIMKYIASLGLV